MDELRWTTDEVPEQERFDFWREACHRTLYGVAPDRPQEGRMWAHIRARLVAGLEVFGVEAAGHRVRRGKREISRGPANAFFLCRPRAGKSWWGFDTHDTQVKAGDLMIGDADRLFDNAASEGNFDFDVWLFPKPMIEPLISDSGRANGRLLDTATGSGSLAAAYLDVLLTRGQTFDAPTREEVGRHMARLVALALGPAPSGRDEVQTAVEAARLQRVLHLIERRLTHPGLNPERAARELRISVRSLHLLLEPTGESFAQRVRRRRLEEVHKALSDPAQARRSITDIAFSCGFETLATFYRLFHQAYGYPPGDVRATAASEAT